MKIVVAFTKAELVAAGPKAERLVVKRLRDRGIPTIGEWQLRGVHYGVLRAKGDPLEAESSMTWWSTRQEAADDGVVFDDEVRRMKEEEAARAGTMTIAAHADVTGMEPDECPICSKSPFATRCSGCGYVERTRS